MDQNSRRALELFHKAKRQAASARPAELLGVAVQPLHRMARADAVDLSCADPGCKRCLGTGLLGTKVIPGNRGCEPNRIPIVCRCVARRGGVAAPSPSPNAKAPSPPRDSGPDPE